MRRDGAMGQIVRLALLLTPRGAVPAPSFWTFLAAVCVLGASMSGWQLLYSERQGWPMIFTIAGAADTALDALVALIVAAFVTRVLRRPGLFALLATTLVVLTMAMRVMPYLWVEFFGDLPDAEVGVTARPVALIGIGVWAVVLLWRFFAWADPFRPATARAFAALVCALALVASVATFTRQGYLTFDPETESEELAEETENTIDTEALLSRQSADVDAAVARITAGTLGEIDLFVVAFAGDGSEAVFANEVRYAERLFGERFGARDRVLTLINSEETREGAPVATRTNLRHALRGIATKMNRDEDILLVFLTTHGSPTHELYVQLNTPMFWANQINPADLAGAIGDTDIRWRAIVVSACYAGGFIPALQDENAAVIAAARADRPSFGCGSGADFTYFGRAFLVEALNETADLPLAFAIAAKRIAEREREGEQTASEPQLAMGDAFAAQWDAWLSAHPPGPPVPLSPLEPTSASATTSTVAPASSPD